MKKINKEECLANFTRLLFQDSTTKLFATLTDTQDPTAQEGGFDFSKTHIIESNMLSGDYCRVMVQHAQDSPHFKAGLYLAASIVAAQEYADDLEHEPLSNISNYLLHLATQAREKAPDSDIIPSDFELAPHLAGMQSYIMHKISATSILLDVLSEKGFQPQATNADEDLADMYTTRDIADMIEPVLGRIAIKELAGTLNAAGFSMQENNEGVVLWNLWPNDEIFPTQN